jgi:hypothetical protein
MVKFLKHYENQLVGNHSIANRILSQCHAIAPEKQGAPILVIGKPTFTSSMKGKRAAPPKQVIKNLSRFFTVFVVGEFNTSQVCGQCDSKLVSYQKSIRMYIVIVKERMGWNACGKQRQIGRVGYD